MKILAAFIVFSISAAQAAACFVQAPDACVVDVQAMERSVLNYGSEDEIRALLEKASDGEDPIVIGAIGGSVTQGAWTTRPELKYAERIKGWFEATFPATGFFLVNAGIGSTDSAYAVERVERDLLKYHPDLVVIDFDVNDRYEEASTKSYDKLVSMIKKSVPDAAIIMLAVADRAGGSGQEWHLPVAQKYGLTYVSMKNALFADGRKPSPSYWSDDIHPGDIGHEILAFLVVSRLQSELNQMRSASQ